MNTPQPGITQLNADLAESLREGGFESLVLFDIDYFHQLSPTSSRGGTASVAIRTLRLV